jgi:hypothetical protein
MHELLSWYIRRNLELTNPRGTMRADLYNCLSQYIHALHPLLLVSILTFMKVELHTGTNFPAVSLNCLLASAIMKHTER